MIAKTVDKWNATMRLAINIMWYPIIISVNDNIVVICNVDVLP